MMILRNRDTLAIGESRQRSHLFPLAYTKSINHDSSTLPSATSPPSSFSFRATFFCSKLRIPSSPHRDIIALSYDNLKCSAPCDSKYEAYLVPRRTYIKTQPTFSFIWLCACLYSLTRCCQHLFTCEHGVCPSHETHCLLVLAQHLPTRCESDDRRRKNYSCSGDRTEKYVMRNRLQSSVQRHNALRKQEHRAGYLPRCSPEVFP